MEVDDGSAAVAAAALIAAALDDLPTSVRAALEGATVTAADAALAARALTRVMTSPSELPELWGAGSDWHGHTEQLVQRLLRLAGP